MNTAIHLYRQPMFMAVKVYHKTLDHMLAAEL